MFISYVFRLRAEGSRRELFTAEIEAVGTGRRAIVHTADELIDFVMGTSEEELALNRRSRLS
jgi:hypothetical protein